MLDENIYVDSSLRCSAVLSDFDSHKSYLIKGSKMWISGGDQGFSENIVSISYASPVFE